MSTDPSLVEDIRAASAAWSANSASCSPRWRPAAIPPRRCTRCWRSTRAGAARLAPFLGLDKSSISRMLAKLIEAGELEEAVASDDARVKQLSLTRAGKRKVDQIHAYGRMQVTAMARLNPRSARPWPRAWAPMPRPCRPAATRRSGPTRPIRSRSAGYQPGMIGHHRDARRVLRAPRGLRPVLRKPGRDRRGQFAGRLATGNHVWLALLNDRIVGSVAIDGTWATTTRTCDGSSWTTAVAAAWAASCWPGRGHCDRLGFAATRLWTFKGLDAARKLYESVGFQLVREEAGEQWGSTVTEQQFIRPAPLS